MKHVVILCGGKSAEHEISLLSARSIARNLDRSQFQVSVVGIGRNGDTLAPEHLCRVLEAEQGQGIEFPAAGEWITYVQSLPKGDTVVFPVLHGPFGEDGTVQGVLEVAGYPYVGAAVGGSAVGMNKAFCKDILRAHGLPVLPFVVVDTLSWKAEAPEVLKQVGEELGFPVFVKPCNMGSSIGISKVLRPADLEPAVDLAFGYDERVLIERGVNAREIEVSVLGSFRPQVSVPGEIVPSEDFYSYDAKYLSGASQLIIPAPLPGEVTDEVRQRALETFRVLQLEGMARVDFLVERENHRVWISEPNTIPGFTRFSMYPKLWEASGIDYRTLLSELIRLAIERSVRRSKIRVDR